VELRAGRVGLRPLTMRDEHAWTEVRRRNARWLTPWEATVPAGDRSVPQSFRALVRDLRRQTRERRALPFAVTVDDRFAGQLTVTNITGGSARWGQVGYWIDQRHAGHGYMPTAVALAVDHCLFELDLHRIEVAIRPENLASLRVVEKLGFTEIGYAPRYLHIDGAWRDHRLFAVTVEECPGGMLRRLREGSGDGPDTGSGQGPGKGSGDPGTAS
jgi:ribosomal-protein-alanine N-acetyltransferase